MKMSNKGIAFLMANEGIVPGPYLDSVAVWTVGVGHTAAAGKPDPADLPKGMPDNIELAAWASVILFAHDLARYEADCTEVVPVYATPEEFDAAVSFHYNTGAIKSATWVATWNAGNKEKAAEQIMNWSTPASIIPRRELEQTLFRAGEYPYNSTTVWNVGKDGAVIWKAEAQIHAEEIEDFLIRIGREG